MQLRSRLMTGGIVTLGFFWLGTRELNLDNFIFTSHAEWTIRINILSGIVNRVAVRFYRYHLKQFTIGNIDMKGQDIWLTFDERVTDIISGMDILKQVIMITNPYEEKA